MNGLSGIGKLDHLGQPIETKIALFQSLWSTIISFSERIGHRIKFCRSTSLCVVECTEFADRVNHIHRNNCRRVLSDFFLDNLIGVVRTNSVN